MRIRDEDISENSKISKFTGTLYIAVRSYVWNGINAAKREVFPPSLKKCIIKEKMREFMTDFEKNHH